MKKMFLCLIFSSFMMGCAALNTVSMTSIPKNKKKPVSARVEKFVILGFNFDNDYINDLPLALAKECPNGKVFGILTKHETLLYVFAYKSIVTASGFCSN